MKCPKCGSEVKPNYKFCSKCGQPMEDAGSVSLKSITIDSDENFKARQKPKEEPDVPALQSSVTDNLDVVRGKAVWSIGPGQLARRVSETEFAQLDNLKGVVIQEGVTAVISVDGQMMGMLLAVIMNLPQRPLKRKQKRKLTKRKRKTKKLKVSWRRSVMSDDEFGDS